MFLLSFYGIFALVVLLMVAVAYHLGRGRGRATAAAVAAAVAVAAALLFPIPIHGGFTFPLEIAVEELSAGRRWVEEARDRRAQRAFAAALEARFEAPLRFRILETRADGWARVVDETGAEAWLESASGLVWRGPLVWEPAPEEPSLEQAQAFCAEQPPQGRWALPTEGELLTLWRARGGELMPGDGRSTVARWVDAGAGMQRRTRYAGRVPGYSLRCVSRSEAAPPRGYLSDDFSLEERNRFQLHKAELFR